MNFNFDFKKLKKKSYHKKHYGKILTVRLPCNPIFPIGPIYLADHIHKCFPNIDQQFIDLAIIPSNESLKPIIAIIIIRIIGENSLGVYC